MHNGALEVLATTPGLSDLNLAPTTEILAEMVGLALQPM